MCFLKTILTWIEGMVILPQISELSQNDINIYHFQSNFILFLQTIANKSNFLN